MMTIQSTCKRMKKWQVINKYGVVVITFKELHEAIDWVLNRKYELN